MTRFCLALGLCLALVPAALAQSKPGDPIKLTVSPAKAPARLLKYRLQFEQFEQHDGNAATDYKEAARLYKEARGDGNDFNQQIDDWLAGELKDFPVKEVEEFFQKHKEIMPLLEKAARRDVCDWGHREGLRKQGINLAIPELQEMRGLIRVVALRSRLNLAKGKMEQALEDVRLGLVVARHTAESPLLISSLVGIAMTAVTLGRLEEIVQQPGAPNLYAALSDLPVPYIPLRKAMEGERLGVYGTFPGMPDSVEDPNAGPLTEKQVQDCVNMFVQIDPGFSKIPGAKQLMAANISLKHERAKKALIDAGRPKEKVEAMPHVQVALLHAFMQYDRLLDEVLACESLPPWEAYPKILAVGRKVRELGQAGKADPEAPAIPLARYFLPASERVVRAEIRIDRRIAALRIVEALRLYAAVHEGQLPKSLSEIKDVTIPVDPLTGKAFEYEVVDGTAVLKGAIPPDEKNRKGEWITYEVTIRK
jgi:hypothetical protein